MGETVARREAVALAVGDERAIKPGRRPLQSSPQQQGRRGKTCSGTRDLLATLKAITAARARTVLRSRSRVITLNLGAEAGVVAQPSLDVRLPRRFVAADLFR